MKIESDFAVSLTSPKTLIMHLSEFSTRSDLFCLRFEQLMLKHMDLWSLKCEANVYFSISQNYISIEPRNCCDYVILRWRFKWADRPGRNHFLGDNKQPITLLINFIVQVIFFLFIHFLFWRIWKEKTFSHKRCKPFSLYQLFFVSNFYVFSGKACLISRKPPRHAILPCFSDSQSLLKIDARLLLFVRVKPSGTSTEGFML